MALILQLSASLFSALWDSEYQLLPEKYLKEVEPNIWAVRIDINDLLPDKDVIFNDCGCASNFRSRFNILHKIALCRDVTHNTYAFVVDYDEIEALIRSIKGWNIVTLSEVAGAYFELDERSLDLEPVRPASGEHRRILRLFCAAGFASESNGRFCWTCEETENVLEGFNWYWRGAEDSSGNRF